MLIQTHQNYELVSNILTALASHLEEKADEAARQLSARVRSAAGLNREENAHLLPYFDAAQANASISNRFHAAINKLRDQDVDVALAMHIDADMLGQIVALVLRGELPADMASDFADAFNEPEAATIPDEELPKDDPV